VKEAIGTLHALMQRLFEEIDASPESLRRSEGAVVLGPAHLMHDEPIAIYNRADPHRSGWDFAAASKITLRCDTERQSYHDSPTYTFSASLLFSKTPKDPAYRWREVSFWSFRSNSASTPYALRPDHRDFSVAILFAKAADKRLRYPMSVPPPPRFFKA
jgi:hypothetical protein